MGHPSLLDRLASGPLLADGATGTLLYARGISYDCCFDALCETDPALVRAVHRDYIAAGARLIETNTFGANAFRLAEHGLEGRVGDFNRAAARLAREVADGAPGEVLVGGSVGPLGLPLAPLGALSVARARAAFGEQIAALVEGGVDAILIETMHSLQEATIALAAAREVGPLPVVVMMTFGDDRMTDAARSPEEVARALDAAGADVIGANCSTGLAVVLDVVTRMAAVTSRPLAAMPNAGLPAVTAGRYIYTASPAYTAEVVHDMVAAGARLVGGCCGTTPEHIAAIRDALGGGRRPAPRLTFPAAEASSGAPTPSLRGPTALQRRLGERFVVTVEVDPPRGFAFGALLPRLRRLRDTGHVDAVDVADNPRAQARMSALVMCALIQSQVGLETVFHVGCRHRNIVAVHSDLLGAHALGVRNIFVVMGDLPAGGDYPDATVNNDITASGLMRLLSLFNRGQGLSGQALDEATAFHIGCAFNFGAGDLEREVRVLERKVDAGAHFALSQPVYDPCQVERVLARWGGRFPIPLLLGVLPLWNARHARFLHHEVPGISIPESVLGRMDRAEDQRGRVGVAVAREVLTALDGAVQGAYFMPPFGRYDLVEAIMAGLTPRGGAAGARPEARAGQGGERG